VKGLESVRKKILDAPVEPGLLASVVDAIRSRFGTNTVRLRSSSNTEDLATFNGAGLHTSTSAEVDATGVSVGDSLRIVWSSLWNTRAYDERDFANIEQTAAAMGVLVHGAFQSEAAQGVAISRNALHATRADQYYLNEQIGEASVTNPAPGVTSDEIVYTPPPRTPQADYRVHSSLTAGKDVLTFDEIRGLGCVLGAIHQHFQPLIDPANENRLFAMQIEWKLIKPARLLVVKQARPYTFGSLEVPQDCREF
jgi:phosphoenolpyruvate synthase/pyruvate phosphate dikinase